MPKRATTKPSGSSAAPPTLLQIVDALVLCDHPILDRRFVEAVGMHPDPKVREALMALPERVAEGSRMTRRAAMEWERVTGATVLDDRFRERSERFLLEGLLDSAESQIRLKSFMAGEAPTREVRRLVDDALGVHHELADTLRHALVTLADDTPTSSGGGEAPVGVEGDDSNLRAQVEGAIRGLSAKGKRPRMVVLSMVALRHLRDQGLLTGGEKTVLGVPIEVDLSWTASSYAVLTYDSIPLEEMSFGAA